MRKETDIDALMAETWLTVALLKQGATTPDGNVLYMMKPASIISLMHSARCLTKW